MVIHNITRNIVLADRASMADTALKRMKGLLGRPCFSPGEALAIIPCQSVHMLFMQFAIDVIFVDRNKHVTGLCLHLKPFQFSPIFWKSACAIELPAGIIERTNTKIGDLIQVLP